MRTGTIVSTPASTPEANSIVRDLITREPVPPIPNKYNLLIVFLIKMEYIFPLH